MVYPMLEKMVTTAQTHKEIPSICHFLLFLALLKPCEHRSREGPDKEGEYLLEGNHLLSYVINHRWEGEL